MFFSKSMLIVFRLWTEMINILMPNGSWAKKKEKNNENEQNEESQMKLTKNQRHKISLKLD